MKKIFYITTIIIGLAVVVMAYAFQTNSETKTQTGDGCWIEPDVELLGDCVFPNDNTEYHVTLEIYNICDNPPNLLYSDYHIWSSEDGNVTTFCIKDTLCNIDQHEECFKVVATGAKVNTVTSQVICSGQTVDTYDCEHLMGLSGITVNLN